VWDCVRRRGADRASAHARVAARLERLAAVQMRWQDWAYVAVLSLATVAADCAVLFAAAHAMLPNHSAVYGIPTTTALFVAYSAGQAALQLPIPGGLGAVESFMTAALMTTHVVAVQALGVVLLYRFLSFWSVVAIGTATWWHLRDPAAATGTTLASRSRSNPRAAPISTRSAPKD